MKHKFETKDIFEAKRLVKAFDMASCLHEIINLRRKHLKHIPDSVSDETVKHLESVFDDIRDCFEANFINLEELIN